MTFGDPWNVKGIRPEARLTATEAARRSGVSVGEWLNSVIIESAQDEGMRRRRGPYVEDDFENLRPRPRAVAEPADGPAFDQTLASLNERFDGLTRQLERLARSNAAPRARDVHDEENPQRLADVLHRLDRRLDQLMAEGRKEIERRVGAVDRAVAALDDNPLPASDELDRAVAEITARQRVLEADRFAPSTFGRLRADDALDQQLRNINTRIETLRRSCGADEAIRDLRAELAEIRRTLTEAMPRRALAALEDDVRALADRLLERRQSGGDEGALAGLEERIAELRDAVRALAPAESLVGVGDAVQSLTRKIETIAAADQDPVTLRQLDEAIASLRAMTAQVATNEALAKIAEDVQGLAGKIDQIAIGGEVLATLDERIAALADALERQNGAAVPPQFEAVLRSVDDKLERLQPTGAENSRLGDVENRVAKLIEKIDSDGPAARPAEPIVESLKSDIAEIKLGQAQNDRRIQDMLQAMQRALDQLVDRLAMNEPGLRAESNSAADTLETLHGTLDLMADRLAAIETELRAETDQRTQDALEALHKTLGQMADRLAVIETDLRASSQAKGAPAVAPPVAPERHPVLSPPPASTPSPALASHLVRPPSREPIDPSLPPDHPLEPGSRGRVALLPGERVTQAPPAKPPIIPDPGGKTNFIAAARRAAQAAISGAAPSKTPASDSSNAAPGKAAGASMRSLLVAIGIVIVLLGTLHVGFNLFGLLGAGPETKAPRTIDSSGSAPPPAPDESAAPIPNRQSRYIPSGDALLTATPSAGLLVPEAADAGRRAAGPQPGITGSIVRLPVVPAATPEYAALPEAPAGSDRLPAAIGGPVLRVAAANGDGAAAYEVGIRYAEGRGVQQNYEEAARWFDRAVKHDLAPAQFRLGSLYEKGLGVKKDLQMARQLYTVAGEKGNAKAMHNLAVLYAEGIDGKPDYASAASWFRKAADRGVGDSQYNLGILYARGLGVEQNLAESYKWFALAAQNGDQEAIKKRDDVEARLDAQSLMAARLAAQTWTADPQPEEATTIKTPPGGWDQAVAGPRPPKAKPAAARPKSG